PPAVRFRRTGPPRGLRATPRDREEASSHPVEALAETGLHTLEFIARWARGSWGRCGKGSQGRRHGRGAESGAVGEEAIPSPVSSSKLTVISGHGTMCPL